VKLTDPRSKSQEVVLSVEIELVRNDLSEPTNPDPDDTAYIKIRICIKYE
jgi:hypothetical protein